MTSIFLINLNTIHKFLFPHQYIYKSINIDWCIVNGSKLTLNQACFKANTFQTFFLSNNLESGFL